MGESKAQFEDEIRAYYALNEEEERLDIGDGVLEFARSQELISRYLSPPPGVILDVGGGSGRYSIWLANAGYEVHLVDPVPKHLDQANERSEDGRSLPLASVSEGDARNLPHGGASCDAVLLMGPLYHLTSRKDRLVALSEAYRVLRHGGLLFAAAINRYASLVSGLTRGLIGDPYFAEIVEADLANGQHRNPKNVPRYFTTAFFHKPAELEAELRDSGFRTINLFAVEGPASLTKDLDSRWQDPRQRTLILDLVRAVENEPTLLGASPHFMAIVEK